MHTAKYTGPDAFSPAITTDPGRQMIFPAGKQIPITPEIAALLRADHAADFEVTGELPAPAVAEQPEVEAAGAKKGAPKSAKVAG